MYHEQNRTFALILGRTDLRGNDSPDFNVGKIIKSAQMPYSAQMRRRE
jgi:hypothetical protein